jgi:hypothetical protein
MNAIRAYETIPERALGRSRTYINARFQKSRRSSCGVPSSFIGTERLSATSSRSRKLYLHHRHTECCSRFETDRSFQSFCSLSECNLFFSPEHRSRVELLQQLLKQPTLCSERFLETLCQLRDVNNQETVKKWGAASRAGKHRASPQSPLSSTYPKHSTDNAHTKVNSNIL